MPGAVPAVGMAGVEASRAGVGTGYVYWRRLFSLPWLSCSRLWAWGWGIQVRVRRRAERGCLLAFCRSATCRERQA